MGLARKLGVGVAGEVLLLVIAQQCGTDTRKLQQARELGIPWQSKRWTSLTGLQQYYNDAVAKALKLDIIDEDAALSDSSARDLTPAPCSDPPTTQTSNEDEGQPPRCRSTTSTKRHHLDKKAFDHHQLKFKAGSQTTLCNSPSGSSMASK